MSACEEVNKYGLREYSFEIGPMDDSSETVAIVGQEYSSVSEDEKFYSKEDVDFLIAEKDKEIEKLKKACNDKDDWCLHTLKENRHHKFWCELFSCIELTKAKIDSFKNPTRYGAASRCHDLNKANPQERWTVISAGNCYVPDYDELKAVRK